MPQRALKSKTADELKIYTLVGVKARTISKGRFSVCYVAGYSYWSSWRVLNGCWSLECALIRFLALFCLEPRTDVFWLPWPLPNIRHFYVADVCVSDHTHQPLSLFLSLFVRRERQGLCRIPPCYVSERCISATYIIKYNFETVNTYTIKLKITFVGTILNPKLWSW